VWLFAAKWGITVGDNARKKLGYVCFLLAVVLIGIGLWTIKAFVTTPADQVPRSETQSYESTTVR
jgi:succinate dehydrogenase / fumarate reductase cytochrome b subunit